jgi:hypothetical protein
MFVKGYFCTTFKLSKGKGMIVMAETVTYRPRMGKNKLQEMVERLHYKLNRFIDDAVAEKLRRELQTDGKAQKLAEDISKLVYEHNGWKFSAPEHGLEKEILKRAHRMKTGKVKSYRYKGSVRDMLGEMKKEKK